MPDIILPKNPTSTQLRNAIEQRFDLENTHNNGLNWNGQGDALQNSTTNARSSARDLLKAIDAIGQDVSPAVQPVVAAFQQAWRNWLASVIKHGTSTDSRRSAIEKASSQIGTTWQNVQSSINGAPDPGAAAKNALDQFGQITNFVNEIGTVAINTPMATYVRYEMSRLYPDQSWADLKSEAQGEVFDKALFDAGLEEGNLAITCFGIAAIGISVMLAFWDAANSQNDYFPTLSKSLFEVGGSAVGSNAASSAITESDAAEVLFDTFGEGADVLAAVIPTGFGIVAGIVFTELADVLINLFFGAGNPTPANLLVALTVPLTVSTTTDTTTPTTDTVETMAPRVAASQPQ